MHQILAWSAAELQLTLGPQPDTQVPFRFRVDGADPAQYHLFPASQAATALWVQAPAAQQTTH